MEDYDKIKKVLALGLMHFLDENRPEGKMCLSNGECADIEKAFNEQDWLKLARYLDKYLIDGSSSEVPNDLEEAAEKHSADFDSTIWYVLESSNQKTIWKREHKETFIDGAKWQYQKDRGKFAQIKAKTWCEGFDACKEQMMEEAVDAIVENWNPDPKPEITIPLNPEEFTCGDKVRVIVLPKDDEK